MADEIKKWPADIPDAKDPLQRRSFERCLADASYAEANAGWFRWARAETERREVTVRQSLQRDERLKRMEERIAARLTAEREGDEKRAAADEARRLAVTDELQASRR